MLLSDEELETLRDLAEKHGLTASDFIRQNLRSSSTWPGDLKAHRSSLAHRLKMVWEDLPRIRDGRTKKERERALLDAHSALAHAHDHANALVKALGLEPLYPMSK